MSETFFIQSAALIRDTFREALARKIFWGLFGISTAMILFFLFLMRIDVVEGATATFSLFGSNPKSMEVNQLVKDTYAAIAAFLYSLGMFLAVFASSGLIPSLLDPGRIELLLSKPVGRIHLLMGRFAGNLLVVAANTTYLVGGVWLILGAKTGVWDPRFLAAILTTVFLFTVLLTIVIFTGVAFESAALSTMIAVAFMIISPILAQEKIVVKLLSSEWSRNLWKFLYYVFPKPFDIGRMTMNIVRDRPVESWMPVWSSAIFAALALALALYIFRRRDF
jgi:ABC-type transport system involved in multi-copper enzyme maturation permease subunit